MEYQSNESVDSFILEFMPLEELAEARRRETEIFGEGDDLPPDEWAIVFETDLPHEQMMVELRALRASKQAKPQGFAQRMTWVDLVHAHALGVRID